MVCCPECTSQKLWKDGIRKSVYGDAQRWLCRNCGYRFSENGNSFKEYQTKGNRQICVIPRMAKNLAYATETKTVAGDIEKANAEIIQHGLRLLRNGYTEESIKARMRKLGQLERMGADLHDPESVKEVISKQQWAETTKKNYIDVYGTLAREHGLEFTLPLYRVSQKLPFIPTEAEIDQLIAGCGKKTATVLQLLKESGMRCGEAYRLKWDDIDFVQNTVTVNSPEKHGNARRMKISPKLATMLKSLPQKNDRVFGNTNLSSLRLTFTLSRRHIAEKLKNPRLLRIKLHTFRHWKATMEYHKTKDILHVRQLLGHKSLQSTLIYTQLIDFQSDEYHCKVAKTEKEKYELIEAGFDHVATDPDGTMYFRKRK